MESPSILRDKSKLRPILNSHVSINSFESYQNFRKRLYKSTKSITINYGSRNSDFSPLRDQRFVKRLLKISNRLKHTSSLRFDGVYFESLKFPPSVGIYLARKIQNIKHLSLTDFQHLDSKHFSFAETWLRRLRDLHSLRYRVLRSNEKFVRNQKPIGSKNILLRNTRLHKNLKNLQVSYPLYNHTLFTKVWDFSSYPASNLQRLSIEGGIHFASSSPSSFEALKNLEHLKISFDSATNTDFILEKFREISNCQQLKSLDLHLGKDSHNLCSQMKAIDGFQGLEKLRFSILNSCSGLPELIGSFTNSKLTNLALILEVVHETEFQPLKSQICHFKALKSFKLKITNRSFYESKNPIEELLNEINKLESLESLQLSFKTSVSENLQKFLIKDFAPNFTPLFKLTTFSLKSNQLQFSSPAFLDFINSIGNTISENLVKLRIEVGEFQPSKTEYEAVLNFVQSLKNIQILKLKSLKIPVKKFYYDLIDSIYTLNHLRALYFGMLNGTITMPAIIDGIHRILLKKGLEVFDYNVTYDLGCNFVKKRNTFDPINLTQVKKTNPFLIKPPSSLPVIFKTQNNGLFDLTNFW